MKLLTPYSIASPTFLRKGQERIDTKNLTKKNVSKESTLSLKLPEKGSEVELQNPSAFG